MVTTSEILLLQGDGFNTVEMYLNSANEIYVHNEQEEDVMNWFFVIKKEEWEKIKNFIDSQYR